MLIIGSAPTVIENRGLLVNGLIFPLKVSQLIFIIIQTEKKNNVEKVF
jgi:hypothetical protein